MARALPASDCSYHIQGKRRKILIMWYRFKFVLISLLVASRAWCPLHLPHRCDMESNTPNLVTHNTPRKIVATTPYDQQASCTSLEVVRMSDS